MKDIKDLVWQGYLRQDGRKGIRNKVLIIYTVECASFVAKEIARLADDNDVEVIGFTGCTDNAYAVHMLISFCRHPNVGAVLGIGLGCEYVQPSRLAEIAVRSGRLGEWFYIQTEGGTAKAVSKGLQIVREMKTRLGKEPSVPMTVSDLVIGAECGGSDYTSGLAGNVVVGEFFDRLVDYGGTAVFEEILEAVGLADFLTSRARDEDAERQIRETYDKAMEYCRNVRQYSISPGNFAGGLTTIEEKSMGAVVKSGSRPIEGVLKVGETPCRKGLWLLDSTPDPYWMGFGISNPNDTEGLMDLASVGSQITFLVTGRGNVIGGAVSPVIKITGNDSTFAQLRDDMDFNAGRILTGEADMDEAVDELFALVYEIASGNLTKGEKQGHKEFFIPYKYQDKPFCRR